MTDLVHDRVPPLDGGIRTRIAPAPSGDLHVGNVRTALYNWALARRHGGAFLLRIEDTDATRVSDEAAAALVEVLHWVGLDWDEGPVVGGPHAPYRQSERLAVYQAATARLEDSGAVYRCYCTSEELAERRAAAAAAGRPPGYDGRCRALSAGERAALERAGRSHVLRFPLAAGATTWHDLVRGPVTIRHEDIPDFAVTRGDGRPLYVLAAAVDDAAMGVTHVVRGEDLMAATPRQLALYQALGHPRESWPAFGHLPLITGPDGKPLSKRNGEVSLAWYRAAGYLPEALLNYLALVGWSLPGEREVFTMAEMVAEFSLDRVSRNPARFDVRKLEAIDGDWIRRLPTPELARRLYPVLASAGVGVVPPETDPKWVGLLSLAQERMTRLDQAPGLLGYLLVEEQEFRVEEPELLAAEGLPTLAAAAEALRALGVDQWRADDIKAALSRALVEGLGLPGRKAFGPVRVAVTGRRVSLPLFESMEFLGRDRTMRRLEDAIAAMDQAGGGVAGA